MTTRNKATGKSERLAVLNSAEQEALYALPDFDDAQRLEFLALDESELALACSRRGLHAQIYCIIQIAYFKAKHLFFRFGWDDVPDDCSFVLSRYFPGESLPDKSPTKHERYAQREKICALYGYRPWSSALSSALEQQAAHIVHRDVTPGFVATELIIWLNAHKIIRPGYSTLQELVSRTLSDERQRLGRILSERLDDATMDGLNTLIERDDTLSRLAILRQDARDFGWRQMVQEREKRAILAPLHRKACDILPALKISQQNLLYYASLANFYTVYDLRELKPDQTRLYLLCYSWVRYRQFSDNLVDAMFFHMKQLEDESRSVAKQLLADVQEKHRRETSKIGRLLSLYVDDSVPDPTTFGEVRRRAWKIMPREALQTTAQRMSVKPVGKLALQWQAVDGMTALIRRHLRPLFLSLDLTSVIHDSPWAEALSWLKMVFSKKQTLSQRSLAECPPGTLPERLRPYLLEFGEDNANGISFGSKSPKYLWAGAKIRLSAADATGNVTWTSSSSAVSINGDIITINAKPGSVTITGTDEKGNTGTYTLKPSYWVPYISSTKMPYGNENYIGSAVQTCKSHGASVMNKATMTGIHSEWGNFYVYEGWERGYYQTSTAYSGSDPLVSNWAFWAESNLWTKNSWSTLFFACE